MTIILHLATNKNCNPNTSGFKYKGECCTKEKPCGLGEGDCDKDEDCIGELVCRDKKNSCINDLFSKEADCCELPKSGGKSYTN